MSEQGDKARKALHDMRWGPHIDDIVERQEVMDDAIKITLGTVAALEAKLERMEPIYTAASGLAVAIESFEGDDINEVTRQWLEELLKALAAAQTDDLASLPTQQKPTEEGMEKERKIK